MLELLTEEPDAPRPVPLVFVHGAWHGAWCWAEHFLPWFAERGWRCLAPSLRHHGGSDGPGSLRWARIDDHVDDLAQVVGDLPVPPVLIGHSMGGFVVQRYIDRGLPLAAAALLAPVPHFGVWRTTLSIARRHPLRFLRVNLTMSLYPLMSTSALVRELLFSSDTPEDVVAGCQARLGDESYRAFLDMLGLVRIHPRPGAVPLRIVLAERDQTIAPRDVRATAAAWGVDPQPFDIAHDLILEPGWEAVAQDVAGWLEGLDPSAKALQAPGPQRGR